MKLLDRVSDVGLRRHLAKVTIECCRVWIERFRRFCRGEGDWRHPRELNAPRVALRFRQFSSPFHHTLPATHTELPNASIQQSAQQGIAAIRH